MDVELGADRRFLKNIGKQEFWISSNFFHHFSIISLHYKVSNCAVRYTLRDTRSAQI